MHHGKNRGKQIKRKLSKKLKFHENRGIYKFCRNRGKFINFVEIRGTCNMCQLDVLKAKFAYALSASPSSY